MKAAGDSLLGGAISARVPAAAIEEACAHAPFSVFASPNVLAFAASGPCQRAARIRNTAGSLHI